MVKLSFMYYNFQIINVLLFRGGGTRTNCNGQTSYALIYNNIKGTKENGRICILS